MMRAIFWVVGVLFAVGIAGAETTDRELALQKKLMAPCCWTQTLNNHHSQISSTMRNEIRQMIDEGRSDEEILAHFKAQYGERILAMPPAKGFNLAAYVLPAAFLLVGGFVTREVLKRWGKAKTQGAPDQAPEVDSDYAQRLAQDLKDHA